MTEDSQNTLSAIRTVAHGQNEDLKMTEDSQNPVPAIREKRGVRIYTTNPSVPTKDEISRHRRTRFGDEHRGLVIDGGTGEILGRGGAYMYEFEEVDKERFVKLFLDGVRKTVGLSTTGLMIFELIYNQVRGNPNSDEIKMSFMSAQDRLPKLAERTYRRGLRELLDKEVIFRSPVDGVFFVNIRCMFNGDRMAFVKAYHLKGSGYQPELQLEAAKEATE
jgi:hypothetical protein